MNSTTQKKRLLIVEDEPAILQGLVDVFTFHGFEVQTAVDGRIGLERALSESFDLILLDVMLPHMDGFSICNEIRKKDKSQPIIMLTAKTSEDDIIRGLTLGADDYVPKPFSVRELVLRCEAVLRRSQQDVDPGSELNLGKLVIDIRNLTGKRENSDSELDFTRKEIEILHYLKSHGERPVSREELLVKVWGYNNADQIETRTVDIHIAKLRRKIEDDPKNPTLLLTIRGEGYRIKG